MKYSYNAYKEMVVTVLEGRFGINNVKEVSITKNNGVVGEGVNIHMESMRISPIIYFDNTKEIYDETDIFEFLEQAARAYKEGCRFKEQGLEDLYEWEKVKTFLRPRVVNYHENRQRLKELPYICKLDLAVIFVVEVTDFLSTGDSGVITVSNHMMESWTINEETLYQQAMKNLERAEYSIETLSGMLERYGADEMLVEADEGDAGVFVGTCYDGVGGASVILSSKILKEFADKMRCSKVLILPSSVNEIILVDAEKAEASELQSVVKEVNSTEVSRTEYLSDNVYCFCNGILEVA